MTHADQTQAFDIDAPFIAQDGLEYEDLAAYICGQPADCWRNRTIQELRANGRSEAAIREWVKGYDGNDPTPTIVLEKLARKTGTSVELDRRIDRGFSLACSLAHAVEPHDDFLPF